MLRSRVYLRGQPRPYPRRRGPSIPQIHGTAYLWRNGLTQSDEIWCDNTNVGEACFQGVSHDATVLRERAPTYTWERIFMGSATLPF